MTKALFSCWSNTFRPSCFYAFTSFQPLLSNSDSWDNIYCCGSVVPSKVLFLIKTFHISPNLLNNQTFTKPIAETFLIKPLTLLSCRWLRKHLQLGIHRSFYATFRYETSVIYIFTLNNQNLAKLLMKTYLIKWWTLLLAMVASNLVTFYFVERQCSI